jgi:hypothetical protein
VLINHGMSLKIRQFHKILFFGQLFLFFIIFDPVGVPGLDRGSSKNDENDAG